MPATRRHLQAYIGTAEYWRLQREAAARGATISKCTADCLREYFALRAELATAIETPGVPGEPHQGAIIHSVLARSEERLVATLDHRATEILTELRRVLHMIDRLAMMYLQHTPEIPSQLRDGAAASANRRYGHYVAGVGERVAEDAEGRGGDERAKGAPRASSVEAK
jgi:hypothetical protein